MITSLWLGSLHFKPGLRKEAGLFLSLVGDLHAGLTDHAQSFISLLVGRVGGELEEKEPDDPAYVRGAKVVALFLQADGQLIDQLRDSVEVVECHGDLLGWLEHCPTTSEACKPSFLGEREKCLVPVVEAMRNFGA